MFKSHFKLLKDEDSFEVFENTSIAIFNFKIKERKRQELYSMQMSTEKKMS